jgi:hypothetical protein
VASTNLGGALGGGLRTEGPVELHHSSPGPGVERV